MLKKILKKFLKREHWGNGSWTLRFSIPLFKYQSRFDKLYACRFEPNLTLEDKKEILSGIFKERLGYEMDWDNPKTFSQKLQWLKLYYYTPLMTQCADKFAVRSYIETRLQERERERERERESLLVPLLGVWDKPEDIPFESLPQRFVLKVNWGSGQNIIVKDKASLDKDEAIKTLSEWMKPHANNYFGAFETCYKDIEPKIIAEEYLEQSGEDLVDYKFMCYNGRPVNMFICSDRGGSLKVDFFDLNFNHLPFTKLYPNNPLWKGFKIPKYWNEMIALSKILAQPFPFVRMDWYESNGKLYFGEFTFYPGAGLEPFSPIEWDYTFGDLLTLPKTNI